MKHYLGIDIGGTAVKLGIVDETGAVLAKAEESVSFDGYRTPILTTVLKHLQGIINCDIDGRKSHHSYYTAHSFKLHCPLPGLTCTKRTSSQDVADQAGIPTDCTIASAAQTKGYADEKGSAKEPRPQP